MTCEAGQALDRADVIALNRQPTKRQRIVRGAQRSRSGKSGVEEEDRWLFGNWEGEVPGTSSNDRPRLDPELTQAPSGADRGETNLRAHNLAQPSGPHSLRVSE
ncbi:hypothetical protein FH972_021426 [Carpinus fangiana]|uniref:Uncharacterized protein n=1 Tax=Carpinus fangiana TaxID=176857 RepID=A0A5N6KPA6_9ROSI|nr:hypothetical protein FH972_021426 [Carpinus fangiana]